MPQQPVQSNIFTSHAQRYPRAMAKAASFLQQVHELTKKGPRTLVATVVDTSFHVTQGYVLCTTELGDVHVFSVPFGTVVPQMRIYARQQGAQASNRSFVFDGYAPTSSAFSQSGSIVFGSNPSSSGAQLFGTTTSSIAAVSSLTTAVGYYWHCFLYLASLPSVAATIFAMYTGSTSNSILLDLLPSGQLRFRSGADAKGYVTNNVVAPHTVHWVSIQPGLTGQELLVDGIANYTALAAGSPPTFAGGANSYALVVLTDPNGNYPAPIGSWVSKVGFGASYSGGVPVALALVNTPPQVDTDIPNVNSGATQLTNALYLCDDTVGSTTAANSAAAGTASSLTLTSGVASVSALGPF